MQFCWTTLHVKDIEKSLGFYHDIVGLPINRRFRLEDQREIVFLGEGTTQLELISDGKDTAVQNECISLGFMVENSLEEIMDLLGNHGYNHISEVITPNPSLRFFYTKDTDGFKVQFAQRLN